MNEKIYLKEQFEKSEKYSSQKDLASALLEKNKIYSTDEFEDIVNAYKERRF